MTNTKAASPPNAESVGEKREPDSRHWREAETEMLREIEEDGYDEELFNMCRDDAYTSIYAAVKKRIEQRANELAAKEGGG